MVRFSVACGEFIVILQNRAECKFERLSSKLRRKTWGILGFFYKAIKWINLFVFVGDLGFDIPGGEMKRLCCLARNHLLTATLRPPSGDAAGRQRTFMVNGR